MSGERSDNIEKSRYVITAVISLILLLMLYLAKTTSDSLGLAYSYDDWHDEEIENAGTVKIPNDWHTEAFDDGVAILDSDGDICMIGLNSGAYKYKDILVSCGETVSSAVLSNSAYYGEKKGQIGDQNRNIRFISFFLSPKDNGSITFYAYDESIDKETIKQMAASFRAK